MSQSSRTPRSCRAGLSFFMVMFLILFEWRLVEVMLMRTIDKRLCGQPDDDDDFDDDD